MRQTIAIGLGILLSTVGLANSGTKLAAQAQNQMGWELFQEATQIAEKKQKKNVLISPTSANIALTMTMQGAKGQTLEEMKSTLAYGDASLIEIHSALSQLMSSLEKKAAVEADAGTEQKLSIANKIWTNKNEFIVNPEFTILMNQYYQRNASEGIIEEVEGFEPSLVVAEVNAWVAEKTNNMIQDLLRENDITDDARMILVNALYFQAQWAGKYGITPMHSFTNLSGQTNVVPAISGTNYTGYSKGDGFSVVEMGFRKGSKKSGEGRFQQDISVGPSSIVLDVIVPDNGVAIADVMQGMNATNYSETLSTRSVEQVTLSIPKFKVDFGISLKDTLINLGMEAAFDERAADLSGLGRDKNGAPLVISDVIQKTAMELDENGLKAAAATAVVVNRVTSVLVDKPIYVNVDRPFGVVLRDTETSSILFIGTIGEVL